MQLPRDISKLWLDPTLPALPPSCKRIVAIDFETSGLRGSPPNYPTELAAWVVEGEEPRLLFHKRIGGAKALDAWVQKNTTITLASLEGQAPPEVVFGEFRALLQQGDCVVAHRLIYDWGVVYNYCSQEDPPVDLHCSHHGPLAKALFAGHRRRSLADLCGLMSVPYSPSLAHGAAYDAERLALCLAAFAAPAKRRRLE